MKKLVFAAFMLGALVLTIASCKKIDNPEPIATIDEAKTATISGYAYVQLVDTATSNGNPLELVPSGTKIIATIDSDDFPGVGNAGQDLVYETTVGADGTYSFTVPTPDDGITVTLRPQDFRDTYIDGSGTAGINDNTIFYYPGGTVNVSVVPGAVYMQDLTWDDL